MRVVHCDNHLLVVDKPAGAPTVPDASGDASLFDEAREWVRVEFEKPGRAFLAVVHRLDRPVSGLVVFGRTSKAASRLSDAFRRHAVEKTYLGLVERAPAEREGRVEEWLFKDAKRVRVSPVPEGTPGAKLAVTEYRWLRGGDRGHVLELSPRTGRSHQLRRAVLALGCGPLLGDLKYGAKAPLADRSIALHAARLEFEHPTRGESLTFEASPPDAPWWRRAQS